MTTVALATGNAHKVSELNGIVARIFGAHLRLVVIPDWIPPEETGKTFEANARIKAEQGVRLFSGPVIADDSGLCVAGLNGAPGVYSSSYAGEEATAADNRQKLIEAVSSFSEEQRKASLVCTLCYADADRKFSIVRGEVHGVIITEERGSGGFGFDPVFYLPELGCTLAELTPEEKNARSHRYDAFKKLSEIFKR